jgi:hypothetical protein
MQAANVRGTQVAWSEVESLKKIAPVSGVSHVVFNEPVEIVVGPPIEKVDKGQVLIAPQSRHLGMRKPSQRGFAKNVMTRITGGNDFRGAKPGVEQKPRVTVVTGKELEKFALYVRAPNVRYEQPCAFHALAPQASGFVSIAMRLRALCTKVGCPKACSTVSNLTDHCYMNTLIC